MKRIKFKGKLSDESSFSSSFEKFFSFKNSSYLIRIVDGSKSKNEQYLLICDFAKIGAGSRSKL